MPKPNASPPRRDVTRAAAGWARCGRGGTWAALVFVAGFAACATSAPSPKTPPPSLTDPVRPSLADLFESLPLPGGPAEVQLLLDNVASWKHRWDMLQRAEERLDVGFFIIDDSVLGLAFLGQLVARAQEGLRIRLLVDSRGVATSARYILGSTLAEVQASGPVEIRVTGAFVPRALEALSSREVQPLLASNHDKVMIADGETAILGGRNIGVQYYVEPEDLPTVFSDVDIQVRGPEVVAGVQAAFEREWNRAEPVTAGVWPLDVEQPQPLMLVARGMDAWMHAPPLGRTASGALRRDRSARYRWTSRLLGYALEGAYIEPISTVRREVTGALRELSGYPSLRGAAQSVRPVFVVDARVIDSRTRAEQSATDVTTETLVLMALAAEREIIVLNPYVMLTESALEVVDELCARGVEITAFTNSPASSDSLITQALFLRMWPEILARCDTARIFVLAGRRPLHGKVAVIDEEVTLLGSYNVDYLSAYVNGELGLAMRSRELAGYVRSWILGRIAKGPPEVVEYRIERDDQGRPARFPEGHPLAGRVRVAFGPEDHCPRSQLLLLRALQQAVDAAGGAVFVDPLM